MKKRLLTLLSAFVTLCGFAQGNSVVTDYHYRSGTVHFNGQFTNGTSQDFPKQILLIFRNEFTNTEVNSLVKVDADGTFASDVYVPHSTTVYLRADSYTGPLPNDLYFFVGDTVTLSVDVAARSTSVAPGSICYWVDRCRPIIVEPYAKSPYGDLSEHSRIYKQGRKAVEDYCRNTGKVMEKVMKDIDEGCFVLPADINPIAAEIIKNDAIYEGLYMMMSLRSMYNYTAFYPEFDSISGRTVPVKNETFEPLDNKWFYKFLKKHEKRLLDNPKALLYSVAGSLVNCAEFGIYEELKFYSNEIVLPVTGGTSQEIQDYAFGFVMPTDYDAQFLQAVLPMRNDTLLTVSDYWSLAMECSSKATGLSANSFMGQWCMMRGIFGFKIKEHENTPDYVASYVAGTMPYITSPILSHHFTKAYREYVKKFEVKTTPEENLAFDPVIQRIIAPYKGNVLFLDFWNMGCGPCRATMMEQRNFIKDMQGKPVKFLYITEDKYRESSEEWLGKTYIEGEHIYISSKDWEYLQAKLRFIGIPFSCIIDMNGTLHRDMNHTMVIEYLP
ncbi:MAG: thioredoxin family protein [Bacteroidaceae bacterium]|nr:thioredoxin family protein [Bacteroidaceae bacterium]